MLFSGKTIDFGGISTWLKVRVDICDDDHYYRR